MNEDDVSRAVRSARETYCQQFGFDLGAIVRDLRERERLGGRRIVSLPPRQPRRTVRETTKSPA
jgi:hypothetical protein